MMFTTVREFIFQVYRLINASNPTIPLHGDDEKLAIRVMNQVLKNYAATGLMLTIAKTVKVAINLPIRDILFCSPFFQTTTTLKEIVVLTATSPTFSVVNGTIYFVGDSVTGAGIPALTTILAIAGNVITLTNNATISGSSAVYITHDSSDPDTAYIKSGRLANLDSAWLLLNGVTYPLIDKSRDEYLASWKYDPLQGLPRFIITFPDTQFVKARLYPAPSQFFEFHARGKFEMVIMDANDTLEDLPDYYELFFLYAVAKYVAQFKGRASAWTPDLEANYRELKDTIEAASEVNTSLVGDYESLLNGSWRVRSGV